MNVAPNAVTAASRMGGDVHVLVDDDRKIDSNQMHEASRKSYSALSQSRCLARSFHGDAFRRPQMRTATLLIVLALLATPALADFTVPPPYEWVVVPCADWNSAMTELTLAGGDYNAGYVKAGDPNVIAMPTTNSEHPWIVIKRVQAGAVAADPDAPWGVEQFTIINDASARFSAIARTLSPVMITTTSQGFLIASRNPTRRRAAAH